ncbi:Nif3-like dinuclear metal center hexameric protein [Labedella endophytica]|uniref:GTP cyclohydrolase 1 type 2 homolog n=1 Tax=Labedella endophytica TaxID=1523160 RepID=A0A3S0XAJ2_9MICO|nr:Nif3-like dinuclear metal center hexameric protein [Labedella endophytica]RUR00789.1 Nif3-like dinuclear metal center hexameric protein [Labedella endophytica]
MSYALKEVLQTVERLWPAAGASSWDETGLVCGHPDDEIARVGFVVDVVGDTVDEAVDARTDLLIAHHPLLLRGVTALAGDTVKGSLVTRLIRARCALVSAHTNADVVAAGTSGVLASLLGLEDVRPLDPDATGEAGIGRIGRLPAPTTLGALAAALSHILPATAGGIRASGHYDAPVSTIALCAGAGDSLLEHPAVVGADVYITSDLRHHPTSDARERALLGLGPALLDTSHWASEWLWLEAGARQLRAELPDLDVRVSDLRTDPWDFVVTQ